MGKKRRNPYETESFLKKKRILTMLDANEEDEKWVEPDRELQREFQRAMDDPRR